MQHQARTDNQTEAYSSTQILHTTHMHMQWKPTVMTGMNNSQMIQ